MTVQEVAEYYDVTRDCAQRFLNRMCRQGYLRKTTERRSRIEVFNHPGPGGIVYRAPEFDPPVWVQEMNGAKKRRRQG